MAFAVTNSGDTDSPTQQATIRTPDGVTLVGADARRDDAAPALHRHAALLAGPAPAGRSLVHCGDSSCRYSVPAHSTLTVTLTFDVAPGARDGRITVTAGSGAGAVTTLSVAPALTDLTLGDGTTTLRAGTTLPTVPITATVAAGVTDPGTITLPTEAGGLLITDSPDDCTADPAAATVTCAAASIHDGVATFGPFAVSVLPRAGGIAHLTADLPGGRTAPVRAAGPAGAPDLPLTITPRGPSDTITLTGPFGGTLVGAPAMECDTPETTRGHCRPGDDGMIFDDEDSDDEHSDDRGMTPVEHRQQVTVPPGATVVSATLTWAMTYPEDGDPANLDAVTFHVGATGCTDTCAAHEIDATAVYPPIVNDQGEPADVDRQWYVRAADVTRWVTGSATVWADGLRAVSTTPSGGSTPMAGWTLSVIWTLPGTEATVELADTGTASLSGAAGDHLTLAPAGAPITDLTQVFWATDPQAVKRILVDGVPVTDARMFGYHTHPEECEVDQAPGESGDSGDDGESGDASDDSDQDDDGESGDDGAPGDDGESGRHGNHGDHGGYGHGDHGGHGRYHESDDGCTYATGMDVVTGITADAGQAVTFTNEHGYTDGDWVFADDRLWLGPTLIICAAP